MARFFLAQTNLPPCASPDRDRASHHLNPSVPHPNRVPSTQLTARSHLASQNRAPAAHFSFFWAHTRPPPACLNPIAPSLHLNPSIPRPNRVFSTPKQPARTSLAKTEPPQLGFCFFGPNQPSLAPHPIVPSHHLNPSVPHPNGVPLYSICRSLVRMANNMMGRRSCPTFYFILYINLIFIYITYTFGFSLQCEQFTAVSVHHGVRAKTVGQTRTCVTCTCDRCGVTGGRYGVTQSHPRCDPCYTLNLYEQNFTKAVDERPLGQ